MERSFVGVDMTDVRGCHSTRCDLSAIVGECGHPDRDADERCRGCIKSSMEEWMEEWDVIMARVQSGWNWRCNVDRRSCPTQGGDE